MMYSQLSSQAANEPKRSIVPWEPSYTIINSENALHDVLRGIFSSMRTTQTSCKKTFKSCRFEESPVKNEALFVLFDS